jgi:hypothetical protein
LISDHNTDVRVVAYDSQVVTFGALDSSLREVGVRDPSRRETAICTGCRVYRENDCNQRINIDQQECRH